ncbi:hypothetical protein CWI38_1510p0020 [Hamiltosporidium tvaerminnensis]|uniref:Leucine-rich repeat-containing protein n=1 Tax=Hamiltosporidium tvaerminnensis TaxID=1176355 RepID=A0A4Q9L706_9MICR|nr:hypothetical protein LUQ84_002235 [Hamiltosporidium tvaerminnensis]TBU02430.1 hypothetical protein CWI37_0484p0010 [Hamiltosporidium tvaerminnensis]TBU10857.1 hypothetical protein CWI38_1510p0020 [Hamiltosporidium tvaerminnensis]
MLGNSTAKILMKSIYNEKTSVVLIIVILITFLKANNKIVFHFYDEKYVKQEKFSHTDRSALTPSKYVKMKFNDHEHSKCIECRKYIIADKNDFLLNFKNSDTDKSDIIIYLNQKILAYKDFLYFIKILDGASEYKENFIIHDFMRFLHILDIFKFQKDKVFHRIIRILLLSTIFNRNGSHNELNSDIKICVSPSLLNIIFYEFGKIKFFGKKIFQENKSESEVKRILNQNFDLSYSPHTEFIYMNSSLVYKIKQSIKTNPEFIYSFELIFAKFTFRKIILFYDKFICEIPCSVLNILFSCVEEFCFYYWNDVFSFETITEILVSKVLRNLIFIRCRFHSFSETFFGKLRSLESIYFYDSHFKRIGFPNQFYASLNALQNYIFTEITSYENTSNLLEKSNLEPYKITCFNIDLVTKSNKDLITIHDCQPNVFKVYSYNILCFNLSIFTFYIGIINLDKIRKVNIFLNNVLIKGMMLSNSSINLNIQKLQISDSRLTDNFITNILMFPNLKKLFILKCTILFPKGKYTNNESLRKVFLSGNTFENSLDIFYFINSLPNLKSLIYIRNSSLCLFTYPDTEKFLDLKYLQKLKIIEKKMFKPSLPIISRFESLIELDIGNGYEEGSLLKFFLDKKLPFLRNLSINRFEIGIHDKQALKDCTKIQSLCFLDCKFIKISFSELFDIKKEYLIDNIFFYDNILTKNDIEFLSNLKHLKSLSFEIKTSFSFPIKWFKYNLMKIAKLQVRIEISKDLYQELNQFKEVINSYNLKIYTY